MAKAAQKPKAEPELVEFFDCAQGSEEWMTLRRGILTGSVFRIIMREGKDGEDSKTRTDLLYSIAGERMSGITEESFKSAAMARGHEMEPMLRDYYKRTNFDAKVEQIGFARRTIVTPLGRKIVVGASPDAKIGPKKGLEIKTLKPTLLIPRIKTGTFPQDHIAQVQGTMMVCDWDEMVLQLGYRGMPAPAFTIARDEAYIKRLREEIERFDWELEKLLKDLQGRGVVT